MLLRAYLKASLWIIGVLLEASTYTKNIRRVHCFSLLYTKTYKAIEGFDVEVDVCTIRGPKVQREMNDRCVYFMT